MKSFKQRVLDVVSKIPKGKVLTYQQVAAKAGSPRACRAVGTFMKHNDNMKRVPCHRVIRSDGTAGFYSGPGGTKGKIKKLQAEGVKIYK
jgi:methylated-DNA-[protein]-cysteine S-methyltransferase